MGCDRFHDTWLDFAVIEEDASYDKVVEKDQTLASLQVHQNPFGHDPWYMDVKRVPIMLIVVIKRLN